MRAVSGGRGAAAPATAVNILSGVHRRFAPILACAAVLSACGGSTAGVATLAPYTGPAVPPTVTVSREPALQAADRLCAATVLPLRSVVTSTYTLDPESLSAAQLGAWSATYSAAAARWRALGRQLAHSGSAPVRGLGSSYASLAAAERVLAHAIGEFPALGGNAGIPGAVAAVVTDVAGVVGDARTHRLPDCVP